MSDPVPADVVATWSHTELVSFVVVVSARVAILETENERLRAEVASLKAQAAKNSGNPLEAAVS